MPASKKSNVDLFDRVKNEVDAADILDQLGLNYENRGDRIWINCPFHSEDTPSFNITKEPPVLFKCFGCGKTGSIIDLVMDLRNLTNIEAAQQIAEWAGIDSHLSDEKKREIKSRRKKRQNFEKFGMACHDFLKTGKKNKDKLIGKVYQDLLDHRHIDEGIIDFCKIGFGGIYRKDKKDPVKIILEKRYNMSEEDIKETGFFMPVDGTLRSKIVGYYTLPFFNRKGKVNYLTARLYEDENGEHIVPQRFNFDDEGSDSWPIGPYRQPKKELKEFLDFDQIYNVHQAIKLLESDKGHDSLFIVEGQFDSTALIKEGYPALAFSGTSNKDRYLDQLCQILDLTDKEWDQLYICYDREDPTKFFLDEESGKKAAELGEALSKRGYIARIIKIPTDLTRDYTSGLSNTTNFEEIDPEELMQFETTVYDENENEITIKGPEIFEDAIEDAQTWMDFWLERYNDGMALEEKTDYVEDFLEKLVSLDEIIQSEYLKKISQKTELDKRTINQKMKSLRQTNGASANGSSPDNTHQVRGAIQDIADNGNLSAQERNRRIADLVIDRLQNHGSNENVPNIFFYTRDHEKTFLLSDGDFLEIERSNKEFRAMLSRFAKGELNTTTRQGRAVIEELQAHAINNGEPIDNIYWSDMVMDTDDNGEVEDLRVYFPLGNDKNELILLGKGDRPRVVSNAANPDNAIIQRPKKFDPWEYDPDVNVREAMKKVEEVFWNQVPLPPEDRLFLLSSIFSIPMIDVLGTTAHIRVQGKSNSGKTEVSKILTTMLTGEDRAANPTDASFRKTLEDSPLVCVDDFERSHFKEDRMKLLRLAITRGEHDKMSKKNEDAIITQKFRALVVTNGIDRITGSANRNRTYVVQPTTRHKKDEYFPERNRRKVREFRDEILSAVMKITHNKIIPNYLGKNTDGDSMFVRIKNKLDKKRDDHPLDRLFGMISLSSLYAKELSQYLPKINSPKIADMNKVEVGTEEYIGRVLKLWLDQQERVAWESLASNSKILLALDTLRIKFESVQEQIDEGFGRQEKLGDYSSPGQYMRDHYNLEMHREYDTDRDSYALKIRGTLEEVFQGLSRIIKESNLTLSFSEAGTLHQRMINTKEILRKRDWNFETRTADAKDATHIEITKIID